MKLQYKLLIGAVIVVLAFVHHKWTGKLNTITVPKGATAVIRSSPTRIVSTIKTTTGTTTKTVPNYGHGTIVKVDSKNGTTVEPIVMGWSNDVGLSTDFHRIGIGLEVGYYKRLGLLVGSHFYNMRQQKLDMNLYVGIGFRIPWSKLNNISVFTAINTDRNAMGGVFIRFGNS